MLQSVCAGFYGPLCLAKVAKGEECEQGVSRVSWVFPGVPMGSSSVNINERGYCGPSDFTSCLHHRLQVPAVLLSAAGELYCAAAGQDGLHGGSEKLHQQQVRKVRLPSLLEEVKPLLDLPHLVGDVDSRDVHLTCPGLSTSKVTA